MPMRVREEKSEEAEYTREEIIRGLRACSQSNCKRCPIGRAQVGCANRIREAAAKLLEEKNE